MEYTGYTADELVQLIRSQRWLTYSNALWGFFADTQVYHGMHFKLSKVQVVVKTFFPDTDY